VLLVLAPKGYLSIVTGLLILTVALGSFLKPTFEVNKRTRLAGVVSSGVVSTVAALGGTPLAHEYTLGNNLAVGKRPSHAMRVEDFP